MISSDSSFAPTIVGLFLPLRVTAIHELTPAQRGVASAKYLMISVSNAKLNDLSTDGQRLFKNAAAYLIGSTRWISTIPATISINSACTDGSLYYATYSNSSAFIVPEGIIVSAVKITDGHLDLSATYSAGDIVAANTGVLVSSTSAGDKTIDLTEAVGETKDGNLIHPGGVTAGEMAVAAPGCMYYKLALNGAGDENTAGFYWGAADGAAFASSANKAYLAIPTGPSSAPSQFLFNEEEDNATNIENVKANEKVVKFIENGRILILRDGITYDALGRIVK